MKLKRFIVILLALVFCLSTSLCFMVALAVKGVAGDGIFIMSMRRDNTFFNLKDIAYLEREYGYFTFTESQYLVASSGLAKDEIEVVGTNENFAQLACLNIIYGSFFNEIHVNKRSNVVVLSSAAAWRFFGGIQSTGNLLYINNEAYQVIGVFESDLTHKDKMLLYMPFENLNRYISGSPVISDIWVNLRDISEAGLITAMMGYSMDDVRILQMEQYKDIIMQRFKIIVFIIGVIIIIFLWKRILRSMKILRQEITAFLRENYISDIRFIFKRKRFLYELLFSISYMLAVLLLLKIIRFKVCIPLNDLTASCFDLTVLCSILDFYMQPYIGIPTLQYLNELNAVSYVLFFVSISSGLAFAYCIHIMRLNVVRQKQSRVAD